MYVKPFVVNFYQRVHHIDPYPYEKLVAQHLVYAKDTGQAEHMARTLYWGEAEVSRIEASVVVYPIEQEN